MLFLNVSADNMVIQIGKDKLLLDRNDIEDTIGPTLINLYNKYSFDKAFVLNGPGGFTNLRVGTLALNLLNSLQNGKIDIYTTSKIDFFKFFVDKGILPNKGIIYIGQKKNVRLYDFENSSYDTIKKDQINYQDENLFFDLVYEKGYYEKDTLDINIKDDEIILSYGPNDHGTNIKELKLNTEKLIDAKYFIQPIMGKQGQ